jgi:putative hydrolase
MNMKVFADYHTHTRYSHGKGSIEDNVKAALLCGLTEIGIADHGPASHSVRRLGVNKPETLLDIKAEIANLQRKYPNIRILTGVEANVISLDGTIDVPYKILQKLDKVLVGLHLMIIPKSWKDGKSIIFDNMILYKLSKGQRDEIRYHNTQALLNAIKLARACAKAGTALEINISHGYLTEEFVKAAAGEGVKFVISSDAHRPEEVGRLQLGIDLIQRVGIPVEQVLNLH